MTPRLSFEQTLLFYDVPHVIGLRDRLGVPYLGFLLEDSEPDLPYIVAPLSIDAYHAVAAGRLTYWEGLRASTDSQVFTVMAVGHDFERLEVRAVQEFAAVDREFWPDVGASRYVRENPEDSLAHEYARSGPLLVEVAFDPSSTGVPIGRFSALLARLQLWLKALIGQALGQRQLLNIAVPAQTGSFKVLLQQSSDLGPLFPSPDLRRALIIATDLIRTVHDHDFLLEYFRANPQSAAPFKEFVHVVKSLDTGITLKWEAEGSPTYGAAVSRHAIHQLDVWLDSRHDAETVEVTYQGVFIAMDLEAGTWRLSDARIVSADALSEALGDVRGKTVKESRDLLRHLVSGDEYTFRCVELQTLDPLTAEPEIVRTLVRVVDTTAPEDT